MKTSAEMQKYAPDDSEMKYWTRPGEKTAAFLLVIPGSTIIGLGIGLLTNQVIPGALIGLGVGLLIWGLIVALSK